MPNANRPSGLSPTKTLLGADWDGSGNIYYVGTGSSNALYVGDPVALSGDGDATRGIAGIDLCTAGSTCVGVIAAIGVNPDGGPYIDPNNLTLVNAPATKVVPYYALVIDDPNQIFEIQEQAGTQLTSADIGLNVNFVNATPATGVKVSATQINQTGKNTTATLNLKLLGLVRRTDNAFGAYAKWQVLINNHAYRAGITGV